ncbi:SAM-dependent methyltransferase [Nocardia rhamnosiphila]
MTAHPPSTQAGVRVPVGPDPSRASIARVYDYALGGKDNFDVDRAAFEQIQRIAPRWGDVCRMNRRWLHRVVRYMAGQAEIDQFLDIGAGLPTFGNTHEVAQQENPAARVIYVDNDPLVNTFGRALLERNEQTHVVAGDLLEAATLLENQKVLQHIDMDRPIGLIIGGLLNHLDDEIDPPGVMREYNKRLPGGSYVAITSFYDPGDENRELHRLARRLEQAFVEMGLGSGWFRTRTHHRAYFDGLELIPPGLTELEDWWPAGPPPRPRLPEERVVRGGVGYKQLPPPKRLRSI